MSTPSAEAALMIGIVKSYAGVLMLSRQVKLVLLQSRKSNQLGRACDEFISSALADI